MDEAGYLKGLITVKDIQKKLNFPMQASDESGRLLCAAAIGVGDSGLERLGMLVKAGVDVAVIDTAHGHTALVLQTLREAKNRYPNLPIIAGNAATAEGVRDLVAAGADAVKIGIGAGSICTTRVVSGAGMPQLTAVLESAAECHKHDVPCIADGGIKFSGDIVKAMAANDANPAYMSQTLQLFGLSYFIGVFGFPFVAGWIITTTGIATLLTVAAVLSVIESVLAARRYQQDSQDSRLTH